MIDHVESRVMSPELWPRHGTVSPDRSAVIGYNNEAYIYQGSNRHYDAYFDALSNGTADQWANLLAKRHQEYSSRGVQILSLVVPNKASCIPWSFPQPLTKGGTEIYMRMKTLLKNEPGVLFSLDDKGMSDLNMLGAWTRTDSHWSQTGCLLAVNEIIEKLGLPLLDPILEINENTFSGDLAQKWSVDSLVEIRKDLCCPELNFIAPVSEFDNANNLTGHFGRHVRWTNQNAKYNLNVTIVGNSFAGPGNSSRELVWWFARLFSSVTFLHMSEIPKDIGEVSSCDVLIFQTVERFLYIVPNDNLTYLQLINHAYRPT
jgi:hypothetical protein